MVKTKKTFYLFCICHASWLAQKSHATVSANQTKSNVTFSDAFRLRLQEFVNGSDYFIWWSDSFTIGRPIYLVSGCKTTYSNHSNSVTKSFLAINGSGKVRGKGRKLGVQNRDFSHFSNSSFHIENEICGSVTSSRGEIYAASVLKWQLRWNFCHSPIQKTWQFFQRPPKTPAKENKPQIGLITWTRNTITHRWNSAR